MKLQISVQQFASHPASAAFTGATRAAVCGYSECVRKQNYRLRTSHELSNRMRLVVEIRPDAESLIHWTNVSSNTLVSRDIVLRLAYCDQILKCAIVLKFTEL
jgi:hypothetical protein